MSGGGHDSAAHRPTVSDDAKTKFREALERKKASQHRTEDGASGGAPVRGPETAGPVQRRFQRKSGSS